MTARQALRGAPPFLEGGSSAPGSDRGVSPYGLRADSVEVFRLPTRIAGWL